MDIFHICVFNGNSLFFDIVTKREKTCGKREGTAETPERRQNTTERRGRKREGTSKEIGRNARKCEKV